MARVVIDLPDETLKRCEKAFGCHPALKIQSPEGEQQGAAYTLADALKAYLRDTVAAYESQALLQERHAKVLGEKW